MGTQLPDSFLLKEKNKELLYHNYKVNYNSFFTKLDSDYVDYLGEVDKQIIIPKEEYNDDADEKE